MGPARALIGQKPMFYQSIKQRKSVFYCFSPHYLYIIKQMKKPKALYYPVIKHSGHLRTLEKCRKHSLAARVFYISFVSSNARRVLSQCNTRLRLLYSWSECLNFDAKNLLRTGTFLHVYTFTFDLHAFAFTCMDLPTATSIYIHVTCIHLHLHASTFIIETNAVGYK